MRPRIHLVLTLAACAIVVSLYLGPPAFAQVWDHKMTVTVDQPFEVPGAVLPAGTYVFRIVDIAANRTVFRIFSEDEKSVYATVMGIPDLRLEPSEDTDVTFYEARSGEPKPLQAWFYTGYQYGLEFVYPYDRAAEIAVTANDHVIAYKAPEPSETERLKPEPTVEELFTEPLVAIEPELGELEIAEVHPGELMTPPAQVETGLPRTATPFPLLAFVGLIAAGAAAGLRWARG
jgi:hypothetical protein